MDIIKARDLLTKLQGKIIDNIIIHDLINNGKSAAVFLGQKDNNNYAIKIFDNDLIERYGVEIQQYRIELELKLKDHQIDNLIKVINGGRINIDSIDYFYLVMQYIDGKNLKQYISENDITIEFIIKVIKTLIETTETLLNHNPSIAHRDIKPENIMISNDSQILLMDLGVLKIIDNPSITDLGQKQFLGTLRYSPPEFLTRKEENNIDGWRSINIYQIGAVLHDLIMKEELFTGVEPYPNLVITIKEDMLKIINNEYPPDLIQMCRNMLSKDWKHRLEINSINKIITILENCLKPQSQTLNFFDDIKRNTSNLRIELDEISKISRSIKEKNEIKNQISEQIISVLLDCLNELKSNEMFTSLKHSEIFNVNGWQNEDFKITNIFVQIDGKFEFGFIKPVFILFRFDNNESNQCKVFGLGILMEKHFKPTLNNPNNMLHDIFSPKPKHGRGPHIIQKNAIEFGCIFDGICEPNDITFKDLIKETIASILKKAVNIMKPEVDDEIKLRKQMLGVKEKGVTSGFLRVSGKKFINDF